MGEKRKGAGVGEKRKGAGWGRDSQVCRGAEAGASCVVRRASLAACGAEGREGEEGL